MLEIKEFRKKDKKKAIRFVMDGMQMSKYYKGLPFGKLRTWLAALNFWRKAECLSSGMLAAYEGEELRGVLMYQINGEELSLYNRFDDIRQKTFFSFVKSVLKEDWETDDVIDQELLTSFKQEYDPDGTIELLAADPTILKKGIGRFMMAEFEKKYLGKLIYLFTDTDCSWGFYERICYKRYADKEADYAEEGNFHILKMIYYKTLNGNLSPIQNSGPVFPHTEI